MDRIISYPGDMPPMLTPAPCDYRGTVWQYADATPENARAALAVHERLWPDWTPDNDLVALASDIVGG